jgi:hypothetical protein
LEWYVIAAKCYFIVLEMLLHGLITIAGDAFTSYVAIPQWMSNYNRSVFLENAPYSVFDFGKQLVSTSGSIVATSKTIQPHGFMDIAGYFNC